MQDCGPGGEPVPSHPHFPQTTRGSEPQRQGHEIVGLHHKYSQNGASAFSHFSTQRDFNCSFTRHPVCTGQCSNSPSSPWELGRHLVSAHQHSCQLRGATPAFVPAAHACAPVAFLPFLPSSRACALASKCAVGHTCPATHSCCRPGPTHREPPALLPSLSRFGKPAPLVWCLFRGSVGMALGEAGEATETGMEDNQGGR